MAERRKDSKGRVLKENETQRPDGTYSYRWRTADGKRHAVYSRTLDGLREKELAVWKDKSDGIRSNAKSVTVNDIFDMWRSLKKGLKENTFQNYIYMYEQFARDDIGQLKIGTLKRSDIRRYYNRLIDERNLKIATVDNIHTVLHQIIDLAVEDGYLRTNISDNALKELKQTRNLFTEKRMALTVPEQELFVEFTLQIIFIHVLIRFYAVLEECMPVEENLRKILMMLEELAQQSLQVKLLIYFI